MNSGLLIWCQLLLKLEQQPNVIAQLSTYIHWLDLIIYLFEKAIRVFIGLRTSQLLTLPHWLGRKSLHWHHIVETLLKAVLCRGGLSSSCYYKDPFGNLQELCRYLPRTWNPSIQFPLLGSNFSVSVLCFYTYKSIAKAKPLARRKEFGFTFLGRSRLQRTASIGPWATNRLPKTCIMNNKLYEKFGFMNYPWAIKWSKNVLTPWVPVVLSGFQILQWTKFILSTVTLCWNRGN